jgi:hypothetical protein
MIRNDHLHKATTFTKLENGDTEFSAERFRVSWQQAQTGEETLPLSQIWG